MQVILKKLFFYIPQLWAATPTLQALRAQTARPAQLSQAGHVGTRSSTTRHKSWDQPQEGLQELTLPHHKPTPFIPQPHCRAAHPRAHGGGCWQLPCNIHQLTNNAPKSTSRSAGGAGNSSRDQVPFPIPGKSSDMGMANSSQEATGHEPVQVCADSHSSSHPELISPAQLTGSSELASSPALCA